MPKRPKSPCTYKPTCPNTVDKPGPCPSCQREIEAKRGTASQRGYGALWRERRDTYLAKHPMCEDEDGCNKKATEVDHEPERKKLVAAGVEDPDADEYLNAKCKPHHSKKTARQNAFGGSGDGKRRRRTKR